MSKAFAVYTDAELTIVDWLQDALDIEGENLTVGIDLPADWGPESEEFVQVAVDDITNLHPIASESLVRVTTWAHTSTETKRIANLAQALLLLCDVGACRSETGPVATRDPDTHAELATFTVVCRLRSTSPPTSS